MLYMSDIRHSEKGFCVAKGQKLHPRLVLNLQPLQLHVLVFTVPNWSTDRQVAVMSEELQCRTAN